MKLFGFGVFILTAIALVVGVTLIIVGGVNGLEEVKIGGCITLGCWLSSTIGIAGGTSLSID